MSRFDWTEDEVALLIETYLRVKNGNDYDVELRLLSENLIKLAKIKKINIDNTFRNINGMQWQYGYIKLIFEKGVFYSLRAPKKFVEMVKMYKEHFDDFNQILNTAKKMLNFSNLDYSDEYSDIKSFFNNDILANKFFKLFKYSKQLNVDVILDKRTTIIGVKLAGERLRYYSTPEGCIKITKSELIGCKDYFALNTTSEDVFMAIIKKSNEFFQKNKEDVMINKSQNEKYVYHNKFGFGKVLKEEDSKFLVNFDDSSDQKRLFCKDFLVEIKADDYKRKIIPVNKQESNILIEKENILKERISNTLNINETDFYEYVKEIYTKNHINDNKIKNAPKHAQKCVDSIREINDFFSTQYNTVNIFREKDSKLFSRYFSLLKKRKNDLSDSTYRWYTYILSKYNSFLKSEKISDKLNNSEPSLKIDLKNVTQYSTESTNRAFNSGYIADRNSSDEKYKYIINKYYNEGFVYLNPIRKRSFINKYIEEYGKFVDSDDKYIKTVEKIGFISENTLYLDSIIDDCTQNEIFEKIDKYLQESVVPAIYYSVFFNELKDKLPSYFTEDMLKNFLIFKLKGSLYVFDVKCFYLNNAVIDIKSQIIQLFMQESRPLSNEEIYCNLKNVDTDTIDNVLIDREFIVNIRGKNRFYCGIFIITDEELNTIRDYINERIAKYSQVSGDELDDFISEHIPSIKDDNPEISPSGVKNYLKYRLEEEFSFKGDVISDVDSELNIKDIYRDFCLNKINFNFEDLETLKNKIRKRYIELEVVYEEAVKINENTFVRKDRINWNIEETDKAIAKLMDKDYMFFEEVITYYDFPNTCYSWNGFLLESYVNKYSYEYKLIHNSFIKDKPMGAIVSKNSNINNLEDLVVRIILDYDLYDIEQLFAFLVEKNVLINRKLKNIDLLIDKAKSMR